MNISKVKLNSNDYEKVYLCNDVHRVALLGRM